MRWLISTTYYSEIAADFSKRSSEIFTIIAIPMPPDFGQTLQFSARGEEVTSLPRVSGRTGRGECQRARQASRRVPPQDRVPHPSDLRMTRLRDVAGAQVRHGMGAASRGRTSRGIR